MDAKTLIEPSGYVGAILVVASMLMTSVVKRRAVGAIGGIIFVVYALLIGSYPLILMNACLIVMKAYQLVKVLNAKQFEIVSGNESDAFVQHFLDGHMDDISTFFSGFERNTAGVDAAYMVFCEGKPAGILLGKRVGTDAVDVVLDYAAPAYRDCSVGKYLYSQLPELGVNTLVFSQNKSFAHISYLNKMGFQEEEDMFVKKLTK